MATTSAPKKAGKRQPPATKAGPAAAVPPPKGVKAVVSEAAEKVIGNIRAALDQMDEDEVTGRRDVGKQIVHLLADPKKQYGVSSLTAIEERLPYKRDVLRPCRDLAEKFTDPEFNTLLALSNPKTGFRMGWSHFAVLSRTDGYKTAKVLADRTVKHGWGRRQLEAEVQRLAGGKKSAGGRKAKGPETVAELVAAVNAEAARMKAIGESRWFQAGDPADRFVDEIERMTPEQREEAKAKLTDAAGDWLLLLDAAVACGDRLNRVFAKAGAPAVDWRAQLRVDGGPAAAPHPVTGDADDDPFGWASPASVPAAAASADPGEADADVIPDDDDAAASLDAESFDTVTDELDRAVAAIDLDAPIGTYTDHPAELAGV